MNPSAIITELNRGATVEAVWRWLVALIHDCENRRIEGKRRQHFVISESGEENNEGRYEPNPLCYINEVPVCNCGQLQGHTLDHLALSVLCHLAWHPYTEPKRGCSRAWIRLYLCCFPLQLMLDPLDNTTLIYDSCKQTQPAGIAARSESARVLCVFLYSRDWLSCLSCLWHFWNVISPNSMKGVRPQRNNLPTPPPPHPHVWCVQALRVSLPVLY